MHFSCFFLAIETVRIKPKKGSFKAALFYGFNACFSAYSSASTTASPISSVPTLVVPAL